MTFLTTTNGLGITSAMLEGVMKEIVALIPVVLPTVIGFIAIRKGIAFVTSSLKSA